MRNKLLSHHCNREKIGASNDGRSVVRERKGQASLAAMRHDGLQEAFISRTERPVRDWPTGIAPYGALGRNAWSRVH